MKLKRKSYIPDMKRKNNVMWMVMTMVSFLVILILLLLLVFGYLDSFNNIINKATYEQSVKKIKIEYDENYRKSEVLRDELARLKRDVEAIKKVDEKRIVFYNNLKSIKDSRFTFAQKLQNSLDRRGILKTNGDKVFIAKTGNLVMLNTFLYKQANSSVLSEDGKISVSLLSAKLVEILNDDKLAKYIKYISIESHLDSKNMSEDSKILANQRGVNFLNELKNSDKKLAEKANKIIYCNVFDNVPLVTSQSEINENERIEISIIIDDAALAQEMEQFLN